MSMKNEIITKRQKELLEIIYKYIKETSYPPTFEDMRERLNVSSNQSIMDLLKKLKDNARQLEPTLRIGKNGLTEGQIQELKKQLLARKLVKIKFLQSFLQEKDRKEAAIEIADKTGAKIIDLTGFVLSIYKP